MALTAAGQAWARRAAAVLLLSLAAAAAVGQGSHRTVFDTRNDPSFGDATAPLTTYLRSRRPVPAGPQHFCIVGYEDGPDSDGTVGRSAEVHWREGHRLIGWSGGTDPESARDAIRFSRDNLDLRKDVVATEADIGGSTYLVTRAWVDGVLRDCAAGGTRYTVTVRPLSRTKRVGRRGK